MGDGQNATPHTIVFAFLSRISSIFEYPSLWAKFLFETFLLFLIDFFTKSKDVENFGRFSLWSEKKTLNKWHFYAKDKILCPRVRFLYNFFAGNFSFISHKGVKGGFASHRLWKWRGWLIARWPFIQNIPPLRYWTFDGIDRKREYAHGNAIISVIS